VIGRPFDGPWTRIGHVWIVAKPTQHLHGEVAPYLNLTRKPEIFGRVFEATEALDFGFCLGRRLASDDFDPAGRTTSVAATAVQDINAGVLDREDQSPALIAGRLTDSFHRDLGHQFPSYSVHRRCRHATEQTLPCRYAWKRVPPDIRK